MCGIGLAVVAAGAPHDTAWDATVREVQRRGSAGGADWELHAAVLSLRGADVTVQPLVADDVVLAWNGEVFGGDGAWTDPCANDAALLHAALVAAPRADKAQTLATTLAHIEGPYAFVVVDVRGVLTQVAAQCVYYGRDPLGRRSLLSWAQGEAWYLASAASAASVHGAHAWDEVPPDTVWMAPLAPRLSVTAVAVHPELCAPDASPPMADPAAVLMSLLSDSVRRRVQGIHPTRQPTGAARVAVLYSGGLDCSVLAALAARYVPGDEPIDLINVAFENPRAVAAARRSGDVDDASAFPHDMYAVPDRVTARAGHAELERVCPSRVWRLIEVNVPYAEYEAHVPHMTALLHPLDSVMDLSIGAALYFAARGRGRWCGEETTSTAPVLLSGLGADELLGGYGRHRTAWERGGDAALTAELQLDLDRLPVRNLGRDDRVISAHGREARYPFLAYEVRSMLASLPAQVKTGHARGSDKALLRTLASELHLEHAATRPKRAIQFGARSAKLDGPSARRAGAARLTPSGGPSLALSST